MRDLEMTGSYESGLLLFVAEMSKHLKGLICFLVLIRLYCRDGKFDFVFCQFEPDV